MPGKIYGLELLRGLCAVLVALYHCLTWSDTATFPTWGLYGVYVFFVISGAVLYHNYPRLNSIPEFLWKRFTRLAPLFCACLAVRVLASHQWPAEAIFLNASMLFGFANPGDTSIVIGGWSLGIEFALYALFPVFLAFVGTLRMMAGTFALLFLLRVMSVDTVLHGKSFLDAWAAYTQPASFLMFFFGGMALAKIKGLPKWVALLAIPIFIWYGADRESVVTGWLGAAYALAAVTFVGGFFWSPESRPFRVVCQFFGDISYGLYLMHPLAWLATMHLFPEMPVAARISLTFTVASVAAWISLRIYERPLRRWIMQRVMPSAPIGEAP